MWENANLNTEATIRPDGTITMPLVGDLKAAGETPTSLKVTIKTKLQNFVKLQGTEITVAVKAWRSYRFTIQGEVAHTGRVHVGPVRHRRRRAGAGGRARAGSRSAARSC